MVKRFIAIEGIDGVGKTTVINAVAAELARRGYRVFVTREPSDLAVGSFIRSSILSGDVEVEPAALALLFAADRVMHYVKVIKPMVESGYIVLTERYVESSISYQGAQGVPIEWILSINSMVRMPDLTVILDAPLEVIKARLSNRGRLEYFERNIEVLARAREILVKRAREMGYPIIDASGKVDDAVNEVLKLIED